MATAFHNLSEYDPKDLTLPGIAHIRFGIAVSEWNENITGKLLEGAVSTLLDQGARAENILVKYVPGSFELIYGSTLLVNKYNAQVVIALGCVVRGDTPHFDYVCQGVTQGIAALNTEGNAPVIYGLVTTNDMEQAEDRAGGTLGNKGVEAAVTAIKMLKIFGD